MSNTFILSDAEGIPIVVDEGESLLISADFTPQEGSFVKANLTSIEATLLDKATNTAINDREDQNVLDTNQGTVSELGVFNLTLTPTDNTLLASTNISEQRLLILTWTWLDENSETQTGIQKYEYTVSNTEASDEAVIAAATTGLDLSGIKRVKTKHIEIETHDPRHVQTARDKENMSLPSFCCLTFCKGTPK